MELAQFKIHEGAEAQLVAERPAMVAALRRRFPGCVAAYLTKEDDGSWLDVVLWRSRAEAEEAARTVIRCRSVLRGSATFCPREGCATPKSWRPGHRRSPRFQATRPLS
ncbi:antibiotic biosynthesis monooxygenase [Amycolatopsis albispora]|nr:antibiotic biosynthesis monooxygenase [Amycolatopsis albispora]